MESPIIVALVSGGVSVVGWMLTSTITFRLAARRAEVDEKLAKLKGDIDRDVGQNRAMIERDFIEMKSRFDRELADQKARLDDRATYAAEYVVHELLMDSRWVRRSFGRIKAAVGGFEDDELRQILVRAGAVRLNGKDGEELWGLIERNRNAL